MQAVHDYKRVESEISYDYKVCGETLRKITFDDIKNAKN